MLAHVIVLRLLLFPLTSRAFCFVSYLQGRASKKYRAAWPSSDVPVKLSKYFSVPAAELRERGVLNAHLSIACAVARWKQSHLRRLFSQMRSGFSASVSVIDTATNTVVAIIPVGAPFNIESCGE